MTMLALPMATGQSRLVTAVLAGILLGIVYTLSPLTVLSLAVLAGVMAGAGRGLSQTERRWYWSILSVSVLARLIAIAALFYTADSARPFASFFGDEELYKSRTMWLRNIGLGIAMSPADVIYSYDDVGHTSYMYVLAFVQALVGDAPYGLHVMNMVLYLCGTLGLYRLVRASYGGVAAMGGLIALLVLPSLVLWSISVLKEPISVFMVAAELIGAIAIVRAPHWWQRVLAALAVVATGAAMESLREGGALTVAVGTLGGLFAAMLVSRGRRLVLAMIAAPAAIAILASSPTVQDRLLANLRNTAFYHAGHVVTPGYSYRLLHDGYYEDRVHIVNYMPPTDAARYTANAVVSYFVQPLPWEMRSRALLAYLPEQVAWYVIALLLPIGVVAGLKRDALLTSVLVAHAAVAVSIVALTSGNVGTLIRHRALALPYLIWLAALGAHDCARRLAGGGARLDQRSGVDGDR